MFKRFTRLSLTLAACVAVQACTVIAIADTAASLAVKGAGVVAGAAIGTVKTTGKVVGAAADMVIPDGDDKE